MWRGAGIISIRVRGGWGLGKGVDGRGERGAGRSRAVLGVGNAEGLREEEEEASGMAAPLLRESGVGVWVGRP